MTQRETMADLGTQIRFLAVDMQKMGMNTDGLKIIASSSNPTTCPPQRKRGQISVVRGGQYAPPSTKIKDDLLTPEFHAFLSKDRGGESAGSEAPK